MTEIYFIKYIDVSGNVYSGNICFTEEKKCLLSIHVCINYSSILDVF